MGGVRRSEAEFSNRMYLQEEDPDDMLEDENGPFAGDGGVAGPMASNFINPVYETMFLVRLIFFIKKISILNE